MFLKDYSQLLKFIKPLKGLFAAAILCMLLTAVFENCNLAMIIPVMDRVFANKPIVITTRELPSFLSHLIEIINNTPPLDVLKFLLILVPIVGICLATTMFFQGYLMSDIGQRVVRNVRQALYEKMQFLSMDFYSKKRGGELVSRITNDVKEIENAVSYGFTDLIYQSILLVFYTFAVFFLYWKLAIIIFLMFPLVVWPVVSIGRALRKISKSLQEKMADINSFLIETVQGIRIVKAFCMELYEIARFKAHNQRYYKLTMKTIKREKALGVFTEFISVLLGVFIVYYGARDVLNDKISAGVFFTFLACFFSLVKPFKKLSQVNTIVQRALAANERIYQIINTQPTVIEKDSPMVIDGIKKGLSVEGVSFRYEDDSPFVLQDINLNVDRGDLIALVGPSGAGKTSLINLILRFYDPQKGKISIDGLDITDLSLKSLRSMIGLVTQEIVLFNDTVAANISYGHKEADKFQIEHAARMAFAHDFINKLPQGYDTVIGDRGFKLSGGEKQRLSIARAILKNPPILILDEATSQLDSESERLVQQALDSLMENRTVFCIAHRLSTVRKADKIVVIDQGKIVEIGRHEELLRHSGLYKKLHDTQFQA